MQKVGKKNGEDSSHAEEEVEVAAAAKEGRVDCSAPGSTTGLDYWPLLEKPASVEVRCRSAWLYSRVFGDHIREQKAMPSVSTSCMSTWVSMGIMTSASLLGSLAAAAARSSSKYCR